MRIIEELNLQIPLPAVRSTLGSVRKTQIAPFTIDEQYPKHFAADGLFAHFKFALRYEPIDLGVLHAAFQQLASETVAGWVRTESTGIYARKLWYLYELLTGALLAVPDVAPTGYVDLLNPKLQYTGRKQPSKRHRINDNLLGSRDYCPLIRRTAALDQWAVQNLSAETQKIVAQTDPLILARAVSYLYTRETKSSFAIEGETASKTRAERFVVALERAADFDATDKMSFVRLQNQIVDPRFANDDWRVMQNYVGQTMSDFSEQVHFVSPRPTDINDLMHGWMRLVERLQTSEIDAVCAAAALSFGFVFLHPFEDGNGRIHRFLIHHELARARFAPPKLIFPVSAVMLRERAAYDRVLESYAKTVLPFIEYELTPRGALRVKNETAHLYRYWDATAACEFLYFCIAETIRCDLREELGFLQLFDEALHAVAEIVDLPDRRASLLVRLLLQNRGSLSKTKRNAEFALLTDDEIARIEQAIRTLTTPDAA
jgi:Fic/DOC family